MTGTHMDKGAVGERIRVLRKARGVERKEIASVLGADVSYITKIEKGGANFTIEKLLKIAQRLQVQPYEFFSDGPLIPQAQAEKEPTIIETFPDEKTKLDFERMRLKDEFVPIRIVATGSLGPGLIIEQEETQSYALIYRQALPKGSDKRMKHERPRIVCAYAKGDSMEPAIGDKGLVAFDLEDSSEIRDGSIYAVYIPDEGMTIKRVLRADEHLILMADNKDARGFPKALSLKNLGYNPIRGRAVWVWNKL